MNLYTYTDYRRYLSDFLKTQPRKGRGVLSQWAQVLGVSNTLIGQILLNKKSLSLEMADVLAKHLNLTKKETDYLILLTEFDRAGTKSLKNYFADKIQQAQNDSRFLKNQIQNVSELTNEARAIHYSNWTYAGITNLVACKGFSSLEVLASRLKLPRQTVVQVIDFLVQHSVLLEKKNGWEVGPQSTYLSSESPLVQKHHQNWRLRAMQKLDEKQSEDLFYTSPMSLSNDLAKELRVQLVQLIQDIQKEIAPSPSEVVRCLNIDWFEY